MIGETLITIDWSVLRTEAFWALLILFGASLWGVYRGFSLWKLRSVIRNTPTEQVQSISVGRTELEGTMKSLDKTFRPPLTDEDCVYVKWEAQRRERSGKNNRKKWETKESGVERVSFIVEDDTGEVVVRSEADRAEFDIDCSSNQESVIIGSREDIPEDIVEFIENSTGRNICQERDGLKERVFGSSDNESRFARKGSRRRFTQTVLPVGTEGYVFGSAEPRRGVDSMESGQEDLLEMRRHNSSDVFLVSDLSEDELKRKYGRWAPLYLFIGFVGSLVTLYLMLLMLL